MPPRSSTAIRPAWIPQPHCRPSRCRATVDVSARHRIYGLDTHSRRFGDSETHNRALGPVSNPFSTVASPRYGSKQNGLHKLCQCPPQVSTQTTGQPHAGRVLASSRSKRPLDTQSQPHPRRRTIASPLARADLETQRKDPRSAFPSTRWHAEDQMPRYYETLHHLYRAYHRPRYRTSPTFSLSRTRAFHSSSQRHAETQTFTHYETLHLPPSATPADIKRQFFTLSKTYHPDKNPSDPTASSKFVAISEAYHTLSVPEKRQAYDRQLIEQQDASRGWGRQQAPHGSHSSHSYAGSRPATGLNKKRGTFRGPPPSFYKSGGYGNQHAKRAEYANYQSHSSSADQDAQQEAEGSYGEYGGFGPGQTKQGYEVPHFNDQKHKTMHDHVNEHISARRRQRAQQTANEKIREEIQRETSSIANFIIVSGVICMIGVSGWLFGGESKSKSKTKGEL
ncbi:hypothetical protein BDV96DRAFT_570368 [Lophiotrema nucula]|uniref:J domain-containing protein n=1 Tax=Lophiotrema nucula TaxID=690887 RepID=A0A6A5ZFM1_9PLEO|nr:hypothetical protein BDV96DRAFT_570368 [Lophiotrema nucula]